MHGVCSNGIIVPICPFQSVNNFDCWCIDKLLPSNSGSCNIFNVLPRCQNDVQSNNCLCGNKLNLNNKICHNGN